ncbi:hypothetical protein KSF78_0000236 [Schistosoma japonicum]|nr:hypothetical protein KSF78_0000236 [Schistosoma japonicum]
METTLVTVLILGLTISHFNVVQCDDDEELLVSLILYLITAVTSTAGAAADAAAAATTHAASPASSPSAAASPVDPKSGVSTAAKQATTQRSRGGRPAPKSPPRPRSHNAPQYQRKYQRPPVDATSTTAKAPAAAAPTKQHAPLPESAPRGPGKPRRDWRKRYGLKPLKDEQKEQ